MHIKNVASSDSAYRMPQSYSYPHSQSQLESQPSLDTPLTQNILSSRQHIFPENLPSDSCKLRLFSMAGLSASDVMRPPKKRKSFHAERDRVKEDVSGRQHFSPESLPSDSYESKQRCFSIKKRFFPDLLSIPEEKELSVDKSVSRNNSALSGGMLGIESEEGCKVIFTEQSTRKPPKRRYSFHAKREV